MRIASFLAALCLVAQPGLVRAEPQTGSRIDRAPGSVSAADIEAENAAARVMNRFARCIARQRAASVRTALSLPYLASEQSAHLAKLVGGEEDCLGFGDRELRFKAPAMVGGLAEQLVLQQVPVFDSARIVPVSEEAMITAGLAPRNEAEDFAQCLALRDPGGAHALIVTEPGSKEEAAAVGKLTPHLGPCLVQGSTLKLTKPAVRSLAAVGLFRLLPMIAPAVSAAK